MERWLWELAFKQAEHIDRLELQIAELKETLDYYASRELQLYNASKEANKITGREP
jgi:hypothetical protein